MIDKILCAIDGSKAAIKAVDFAVGMAAKFQAELQFVTVSTVSQESASKSAYWDSRLFEAGERQIARELSEALSAAKAQGVQATCATISGRDIAAAIVSYAQSHAYDHIVMGSTGHTAFGRLLMGSVVDDVLKRAHPPVTVV
ncbi:universal stress protein [Sedimentitalea nanhaiensis]|uniref:Nucleotide-binding universal stress protein, UspA family n=1 Tax=Sedimentitalea nanhaiensis TaxID=999627 RepID=A0A1I7C2X0_9RHOB|nr:universal stress protein [Sedimentitalea nanhaiensis]SFT93790.1 Nucleotide-binding universal stress protein, UspA family [Sedimentitalea nanhaiensis]